MMLVIEDLPKPLRQHESPLEMTFLYTRLLAAIAMIATLGRYCCLSLRESAPFRGVKGDAEKAADIYAVT
jgi:hypothetical protein